MKNQIPIVFYYVSEGFATASGFEPQGASETGLLYYGKTIRHKRTSEEGEESKEAESFAAMVKTGDRRRCYLYCRWQIEAGGRHVFGSTDRGILYL